MTSSPKSPASDDRMNESSSTDDEEVNNRREANICERNDEQTKKKFKSEPVSKDPDRSKLSVEELPRQPEKAQRMENIDRYREDNRFPESKSSGQHSEQRKWEEDVIQSALPHYGSLDKEAKSKQPKYDYILDEEIQFVQQLTIPGVNEILQHQKDKPRINEHEDENKRKHRSLQETRKTLPIYRFREDLMNAIRDHT